MNLEQRWAQEMNKRAIDACTDLEELKTVTKNLLQLHEGYRKMVGEMLKDVVVREAQANLTTKNDNSMVHRVLSMLPAEQQPGPEFWDDDDAA